MYLSVQIPRICYMINLPTIYGCAYNDYVGIPALFN